LFGKSRTVGQTELIQIASYYRFLNTDPTPLVFDEGDISGFFVFGKMAEFG
jgi:hypothetical protein